MGAGRVIDPADVRELLRLVEGLADATVPCACRRLYRVGISTELRAVIARLRPGVMEATGDFSPDTTRFAMLEVDDDAE